MGELRGWVVERAAGLALLAVIFLLAIIGRRERMY
jgi:hypothetical protein